MMSIIETIVTLTRQFELNQIELEELRRRITDLLEGKPADEIDPDLIEHYAS